MSSKEKKPTVFTKMLITEKVPLDFRYVNRLLTDNLYEDLKKKLDGKCCEEGYIKPESINIINYSSGIVKNNLIIFDVVFESQVCYLVEGMEINCIAKNITKAGIRAELDMDKTPAIIFVARDHHYTNKMFNEVEEGNYITVKIIGQRFELNDTNVSAIAELVKVNKTAKKIKVEDSISSTEKKSIEPDKEKEDKTELKILSQEKSSKDVVDSTKEASKDILEDKDIEVVSKIVKEDEVKEDKVKDDEDKDDQDKEDDDKEDEDKDDQDKEDEDKEDQDSEAIKALEKLELELEPEKEEEKEPEKEITIVSDKEPPKRKRGRPRKNPV